MKHDNLLAGLRKLVVAAGLATLGSVLVFTISFAQSSANCRAYAEDYSLRYSAPWAALNFNIGGGAPALVRWPPIGPAPFNSPPSSTTPTHAACAVGGRKRTWSERSSPAPLLESPEPVRLVLVLVIGAGGREQGDPGR
jgi:hypothetical protein